jgi:uncharacterized membrane protein YphA (DoxX/SURF4 family)
MLQRPYTSLRVVVQRLFSTFARGWPGVGLLVQRLVTAALLFHSAIAHAPQITLLPMIAAGTGLLLLIGLWTPLAGITVALSELSMLFSHQADPLSCVLLATLGATSAMIGPGAWSIDARLFGRKEVRI